MNIFKAWKTALLSLFFRGSQRTQVQASYNTVVVVLTQYEVKASFRDEFLEVLSNYIHSSLISMGNVMAEGYYEQGDACMMWVIERWRNLDFYNSNKKSAAAKVVNTLMKNALVFPNEIVFLKDLELLSKVVSQEIPLKYSQEFTVMLFVDVKTGCERYFRSINRKVMTALSCKPGLLMFQLSQLVNNNSRFVVLKKFQSRNAFQSHLKEPAVQPIIKFLQTSIKDPPFEKGYHLLIEFAPMQIRQ